MNQTTAEPIYITACGMLNALGNDKAEIFDKLTKGDVGGVSPWEIKVQDKTVFVGKIQAELPEVPQELATFDCRNNRLILAGLNQIQSELDVLKQSVAPERIAIVLGSSTSGILEGEDALEFKHNHGEYPPEFHYRQQEIGTSAVFLREYLGFKGLAYTVSTACSSSAKVFASARRLIHSGLCDAAIVGGIDSLCRLTVNGFSALESVSAGRCNPMSRNRDGINIGEAAALFILSKQSDGIHSGEIRLLGVGESSDAHHMSAPHPEGKGAIAAMQAALDDAGLSKGDISYINMHGTATPLNDAMESIAINKIFGPNIPVSSTKPLVGHTLGAAGGTEAGFCWLLLQQSGQSVSLPPHIWDGAHDERIPGLNLVQPGDTLAVSPGTALLSNSFAFGGNNASVILGRI